jgi:pyrroloquinoline quinone biosynthesis protein E
MSGPAAPLALLAELTHRCPLRCPYCYNTLELEKASAELATDAWKRVLDEAAELGILQVHFSGGEPTARADLVELVGHATHVGLYANLITSGVLLDAGKVDALCRAGLEHVQLSFQDTRGEEGDRIAGHAGAHAKKLAAARLIREAGLSITLNAVVHRGNIDRLEEVLDLAVTLGARRIEVAQVQYYGWALANRAAFMPTRAQLERATEVAEKAMERLKGVLVIDYVVPDYYARHPKACMGGWGRRFLNVTPSGKVLPCHAAETIPGLRFDRVGERSLADIWQNSEAFRCFRGTGWMPEPCRSCERREVDWGGCRCQALALTGDARNTDPACEHSPHHAEIAALAEAESGAPPPPFVYRHFRG